MALPDSGFSLADVRAEIVNNGGSVTDPFTLSQAIEIAGKTGVWNKLSDFAGWSYAYLDVSPQTLTFDVGIGSQTVNISSNQNWTVSNNNYTWISVGPTSGSGDGTLIIYVDDNTTGSQRTGTVTVQTSDGSITRNISIIQNG